MTALTLYFVDAQAGADSLNGQLQVGGSAPSVSTMVTGWRVGTSSATTYSELLYGTRRAATTFTSTVRPDGTTLTTGCFETATPLSGTFANANWTIAISVIGNTAAASGVGNLRVRVWASQDQSGATGTRELTGTTLVSTSWSNVSTSTAQNLTITWSPGATNTLRGEYVFLEIACEVTTASGGTTAGVVLRQDGTNSVVTTSDWTPDAMGWVQGIERDTTTSSVDIPYTVLPQTAGNCNIIYIIHADNTLVVSSVTDTSGNVYSEIVTPYSYVGAIETVTHTIWAAPNIVAAAAGANTVTVTLSGTSVVLEVIAAEYYGVKTSLPLVDKQGSAGSDSTTSITSSSFATTQATELILGLAVMVDGTPAAGSGFTLRLTAGANTMTEDRYVTSTGTYSAVATQTSADQASILGVALFGASSPSPAGPYASPSDPVMFSTEF